MAKRGLGKGLGVLFGEDVAQEETPVVKRERKTTPKKTESNKKTEETAENVSRETSKAEPVIIEKIVEIEKGFETTEKILEKNQKNFLKRY